MMLTVPSNIASQPAKSSPCFLIFALRFASSHVGIIHCSYEKPRKQLMKMYSVAACGPTGSPRTAVFHVNCQPVACMKNRNRFPIDSFLRKFDERCSQFLHKSGGTFAGLKSPQCGIATIACHQFIMRAAFHNPSGFEQVDAVGLAHGGQAVGNDHGGAVAAHAIWL